MSIFITLLYLLLFLWLIRSQRFFLLPGLTKNTVTLLFLLKIAAGALLYFIYTEIYPNRNEADIFKYYNDSFFIDEAFRKGEFTDYLKMLTGWPDKDQHLFNAYYSKMSFWEFEKNYSPFNDSQAMIRINALLRLITGKENYFSPILFFIFFSFTGLCALYRFFETHIRNRKHLLIFSVFLVPSVILWSGGNLKESILFLFLGSFLYALSLLLKRGPSVKILFILIVSLAGMIFIKTYTLLLILPALGGYIWSELRPEKSWFKYFLSSLIYFLIIFNIHHVFPSLKVVEILSERQKDFISISKGQFLLANDTLFIPADRNQVIKKEENYFGFRNGDSVIYYTDPVKKTPGYFIATGNEKFEAILNTTPANSRFDITNLEGNFSSFLKLIPEGLFNTLIRPSYILSSSKLTLLTGIENTAILIFLLFGLVTFKKENFHHLFWFAIIFSCGLFILSGITVPIIGAIVRYKVPALPFLIVGIGMLSPYLKTSKSKTNNP